MKPTLAPLSGVIRPAGIVAALMVACLAAHRTEAQTAVPEPQWQFSVTPYLWVAGVGGDLKAPALGIPARPVTASFHDILSHLNTVPIMGAAEARYGRFGVIADIVAISVSDKFGIPGPYFSGGKAEVSSVVGTALGAYRVADSGRQILDLGVGVRAFGLSTKFTLHPGLLSGATTHPGSSWAAPVAAARYHVAFGPSWGLTAYGDIGAGPDFPLTWQVLGTVDYQLTPAIVLRAGYRHLRLQFNEGVLHQDIEVSGPILGATMRF